MSLLAGPVLPPTGWPWYETPEKFWRVNLGPIYGAIVPVTGKRNFYQIHFGGVLLGHSASYGVPFSYAQQLIAKAAGEVFNATV